MVEQCQKGSGFGLVNSVVGLLHYAAWVQLLQQEKIWSYTKLFPSQDW